jgi:hypothetical protein
MMLAAETEWCGSLYGGLVINSSGGVPSVGSIKIVGRRCWSGVCEFTGIVIMVNSS